MDAICGALILAVLLGYSIYITVRYTRYKEHVLMLLDSLFDTINEKQEEIDMLRRLP